jgi:hypothetical protein
MSRNPLRTTNLKLRKLVIVLFATVIRIPPLVSHRGNKDLSRSGLARDGKFLAFTKENIYDSGVPVQIMLRHQSTFLHLLLCIVVCLLLSAIISAELPELLTLSDNTSNDFTGRKAGSRECIGTLDFAVHKSVSSNLNFRYDAQTYSASLLANAGPNSYDLPVLHSVLRT